MPNDVELNTAQRALVEAAAEKAHLLYEGKVVRHRSCGIALAQTFNVPHKPYQALRKGGLTGAGECGAIKAGELVLGEFFGDPDPAGAPTQVLREAAKDYQERIVGRVSRGASPDYRCNNLTAQFGEFSSPARAAFCTSVAANVARTVAEIILERGGTFEIIPVVPEPLE